MDAAPLAIEALADTLDGLQWLCKRLCQYKKAQEYVVFMRMHLQAYNLAHTMIRVL